MVTPNDTPDRAVMNAVCSCGVLLQRHELRRGTCDGCSANEAPDPPPWVSARCRVASHELCEDDGFCSCACHTSAAPAEAQQRERLHRHDLAAWILRNAGTRALPVYMKGGELYVELRLDDLREALGSRQAEGT